MESQVNYSICFFTSVFRDLGGMGRFFLSVCGGKKKWDCDGEMGRKREKGWRRGSGRKGRENAGIGHRLWLGPLKLR